ncbi:uncharacterized protein LOC133734388 isoform X1 [Rosa rugosa]|uniref:uncharacterized protein LOC133734388 isoform X1 n=1 Tax=Rosa rugosa TaxID=74645 RepID=UPI002B4104D4|nr:uncharacterized protein LOC133734388 isoform X1 [Rosa rugosa]
MSLCDENNVMDLSAFRLAGQGAFNPDSTEFVPIIRPCKPGALDRVSLLRQMENTGPKGTHSMTIPVQRPRPIRPPEGRCLICSLDEHTSSECPYNAKVPKNATVGRGCDVFCKVCDDLFYGRCCNQDSGRAKLKFCNFCSNYGEH